MRLVNFRKSAHLSQEVKFAADLPHHFGEIERVEGHAQLGAPPA